MEQLNFETNKSNPSVIQLTNLSEGRLIGLDSFLTRNLDIRNGSETNESYTGGGGQYSDCSDYCTTSTCAVCC